eukprot:COSAG02_NODE_49907_length_324_cov_0.484444_1_plen_74_part_01
MVGVRGEGMCRLACGVVSVALPLAAAASGEHAPGCLSTDALASLIGSQVEDPDGLAEFFGTARLCVSEAAPVDQ